MKHFLCLATFAILVISGYSQPVKKAPAKPAPVKKLNLTSPTDLRYLVPPVKLEPSSKILFSPENFYIEQIEDSSGIKDAGFAILPKDYRKQPIAIAGNPEKLFSNYIQSITRRNKTLLPLVLRLKQFRISEKQLTKADMLASFELAFDVYFREEGKLYFLDRFADTLKAEIYVGFKREYDEWLKKSLAEFMQVLDLLTGNTHTGSILLPGEKAVLTMLTQEHILSADTMVLTPQTPLKWADFTGTSITPDQLLMSSSLYLSRRKETRNGQPFLVVQIEPVMVRNKSWCGFIARSNTALLNNQRYELLLIYWYALQLKKQLEPFVQPDSYSLFRTEMTFYNVVHQLTISRNRYNEETAFGENTEQQEKWEDRIRRGIISLQ